LDLSPTIVLLAIFQTNAQIIQQFIQHSDFSTAQTQATVPQDIQAFANYLCRDSLSGIIRNPVMLKDVSGFRLPGLPTNFIKSYFFFSLHFNIIWK
jgi:hypothetical protein